MTTISIKLDKSSLVRAMAHLSKVVERRNTIPVLSNVLLRTGDQYLAITGTDLDIEAITEIDCDMDMATAASAAAITVPAAMLHDIARRLPDGAAITMAWETGGSAVSIRAGRSRFSLQALPADDFPELGHGEFPHSFTMPASALADLIARTEFAISTEETRYYLNGIYLHVVRDGFGEPRMRAVATDGHRLARVDMPAPLGLESWAGETGIIIPRKTVGELARLAKETDGDISLSISTSKIRASSGSTFITSKLIDGTFPDYTRVIPTRNGKLAELDREAFAKAADRVATISSERGRAVKLSLREGIATLSVTNPDSGTAEEEIEAAYDADKIDIGFNSRYLADCLSAISGERVHVALDDPGSPTIFRNAAEDDLLVVLMPMRV